MRTYAQDGTVSLRNVMLLTVCTVLFLSATVSLGVVTAPPHLFPNLLRVPDDLTLGTLQWGALVACPLAYLWVCMGLAGNNVSRWASLRYALRLQLQALVEIIGAVLSILPAVLIAYVLAGLDGDTALQQATVRTRQSENTALALYLIGWSSPALSILMTVWRLHALSRSPAALQAAIEGRLCRKEAVVQGDADDVRRDLARHLERLTGPGMPGLARVFYKSSPRMVSRDDNGELIHELIWALCPVKLIISCHDEGGNGHALLVRCVLRGGVYRLYLVQPPADALAQMQYADTHLLSPLVVHMARVSAERQRDALRDHATATQLRILQAQIEPHFLFNTLANVRQLYRSSLAEGENMMDHLISYLRCAMDDLRAEHSTVVKEMDLAMHYLSIMKIRMGKRLSYQFSLPDSLLAHPFPPAMLISLIENAIKHGLAHCEHGQVVMSVASQDGNVRVTVADNGAGFSSVGGTGLGLSNIRQRLEAMYGSRAWLEVGAPTSGGFTATIVIPSEERSP